MAGGVVAQQQKASLTRTLRVGDSVSLDNGAVVIRVVGVTSRRGTLNLQIDRGIAVDKPPPKKNP